MRLRLIALIAGVALAGCSSEDRDGAPLQKKALADAPPLQDAPPPFDAGLPRDRCAAVDAADRRGIVYLPTGGQPGELMTVQEDGSGDGPLGRGDVVGGTPSWSPDGCAVAFITYRDEGTSLAVASADGGNPTTVYASDALFNRPEWSPSGDELVFVTDPVGVSSIGPGRMFRVSARGGRPQEIRIPNDINPLGRVAWSPAGDALVFSGLSASNDRYQLFAMRPDGSGLRRLTRSDETNDGSPDWAPDGRRFAFTRREGLGAADDPTSVFVVDRDGGEPTMVGSDGTDCCGAWSPDGRSLVIQREAASSRDVFPPETELWVVDVESGEERRLAPAPAADADWSSADPP